jgi:hypothetical protein
VEESQITDFKCQYGITYFGIACQNHICIVVVVVVVISNDVIIALVFSLIIFMACVWCVLLSEKEGEEAK